MNFFYELIKCCTCYYKLSCQNKSNKIVDYTLKYINKPVGVSEYKIFDKLSKEIQEKLPSKDDINVHLEEME